MTLAVVGLALIVVLTAATGYFVAQEFAYVAVDRERLRARADGGDAASGRALAVTSRLSFVLSGAQLGITVTALLAGYVAEPFLGEGLARVGDLLGVPAAIALAVAVAVALLVTTAVQMVLGELAPKNLAIAKPQALARGLARSTLIYLAVAGPVIRVFDATSTWLLRRLGIEPVQELPHGATVEDLDRIIAASRADGLLDAETSRLLDHGLDFRDRTAAEAMVPRVDVVTVGASEPAVRVVELLDTGHSRFPVIGEAIDDVIGIVSISDVVDLEPADRRHVRAGSLAGPALRVPTTLSLPAVLEQLRAEHQQLACVIDEFGGLAGVIGLENVAEELVGQIRDEDDPQEPAPVRVADGSWLVPGRWRLDQIAEATGVALPEGEAFDTLSGLVMHYLRRVPRPRDETTVDLPPGIDEAGEPVPRGSVRLRVELVRRHVPAIVLLTRVPDAPRNPGTREQPR